MLVNWHFRQNTQRFVHRADAPSAGSAEPVSLAVDVIELLSAVLAQSPSNRRSMQQIQGERAISGLIFSK